MLGVHKNAHLVSLQNVQPLPIIKSANSVCHLYRMYGEIPIEFFAIEIFVADCQRWKKNTLGKKTWGRFIEERKFRFIRQTEFSPVLLTVCIFSSQSLEVNATVPYSSCLDLVKVGTCLRYTSFIESLLCGYFWTFLENWGTKLWYKKMRDKFIAIKRKILYNPNNGIIIFTAVLLKRFFG